MELSLCGGESLAPENLNTEGVLTDGERVYTYSAISGGSEAITQVLHKLRATGHAFRSNFALACS